MAAVSQFVVLMVLVSCGLAGVDAKAGSRDAQRRARQAPSGPRIPKVEVVCARFNATRMLCEVICRLHSSES